MALLGFGVRGPFYVLPLDIFHAVIPALLRIALAQRDSEDNEMVNDMFVAMCFPTTRRESRHLNTRKPLSRPGDPNPTLLQCSRVTTVEPRADGVRNI